MIRHIPRKHYTEEKDILFDTFQQLPMMPSGAELSKDSLLLTTVCNIIFIVFVIYCLFNMIIMI